jgi:SAM-dependent methyltransferase
MKTELLLGCGNSRQKKLHPANDTPEWSNLITLDFNEDCRPYVVHDLEDLPYPFEDNRFDEIHAYEVLEHIGDLGDWRAFFDQFSELHRILKPGGRLFAMVPMWNSIWAFGDPSHRRVISKATIAFLCQEEYKKQVGKTAMSDFRSYYKADFRALHLNETEHTFTFVLEAVK